MQRMHKIFSQPLILPNLSIVSNWPPSILRPYEHHFSRFPQNSGFPKCIEPVLCARDFSTHVSQSLVRHPHGRRGLLFIP
jgi:hypothetical protein